MAKRKGKRKKRGLISGIFRSTKRAGRRTYRNAFRRRRTF